MVDRPIQALDRSENRFIQAHDLFTSIHLLGGYPLGVLLCAGLSLSLFLQFQAFLASSPLVAIAGSYLFASTSPLPWRSADSRFARFVKFGLLVLASVSNPPLKPIRLRRPA